MTATTTARTEREPTADDDDLHGLGYEPLLHRRLGRYASFAAGFSFVSILTTVFQLFGFGYSFDGPVFFWTWPAVLAGQFLVALCFAELAARYPISGAIFQWSRRMGGETVGWFAGWFMIIAQGVTAAAAAIALQVVLPDVWGGFQVVGGDPALTSTTGSLNAVVLGAALLVLTTVVNAIGVQVMSRINAIGVTCEIVGVVCLVLALLAHARRGPGVVTDTSVVAGSGTVGAFLASGLMAAYVMVGFDSAGELSEETKDPRRTAPRTILSALAVSGIGGGLLLVAALMAAPRLAGGQIAASGLPYVTDAVLGSTWGTVLLVDVAVAVCVCTLAIQTAGSRLVFSMARDGQLPLARRLAHVDPRHGTPLWPSVVIGVLALAMLAVNTGNAAIFTTLSSVCIVMLYVAYLLVTVPMLLARLRGWPGREADEHPRGLFSLGRAGVVVNALAVLYGAFMVVDLAWPRASVYDPAGDSPWLVWSAPAVVVVVAALGVLARAGAPRLRHGPGAAASGTAADVPTAATEGGGAGVVDLTDGAAAPTQTGSPA